MCRIHISNEPELKNTKAAIVAEAGKTRGLRMINDRSYRKRAGEHRCGAAEHSGRRAFDKTVSSKPLAFAADAAAMGIDCCCGTRVWVGEGLSADSIDPCGG
jgi:hypothetical protein